MEDFVKARIEPKSINIPCGKSQLGDFRVDIDPSVEPDMVADIFSIDISTKYRTVISDPIWTMNTFHRPRWFYRAVDLCEVGGTIIYNAPWIPESKAVELKETFIRRSARFGNVSILSVFLKTNDFSKDPSLKKKVRPSDASILVSH